MKNLEEMFRGMSGAVGLPNSELYHSGTRVWAPAARLRKPLAVIKPTDQEGVARTLRCANAEGLRVSPRSGGHSFDGFPVQENTILLDLSGLNETRLDSDGRLHAGPGTRIEAIAKNLSPAGCAVPTGDCPTVALGGLITGGGFGYATRKLGMTLDNLVEATMVTAMGDIRRIDAERDPDLFWACRGGGSAAGVVTEFVIKTFAVDQVTTINMVFHWESTADIILSYDAIMRTAPRELDLKLKIRSTGIGRYMDSSIAGPEETIPGIPLVHVDGQYMGSRSGAESLLRQLLDHTSLRDVTITEEGYFEAMMDLAPLPTLSEPSPDMLAPQRIASDFSVRDLVRRDADAIVNFIAEVQEAPDLWGGALLLEPADGIVHEIAQDATAFPHRTGRLVFEWELFQPLHATVDQHARLDGCLNRVRSQLDNTISGGRYLNYADRLDRPQHWWGGNTARLEAIASHFDPEATLVSRLRPAEYF